MLLIDRWKKSNKPVGKIQCKVEDFVKKIGYDEIDHA
jgi:hypothetical protein